MATGPTLQGRLNNPLTSTREALEQLEKSVPLTEHGKMTLTKILDDAEWRMKHYWPKVLAKTIRHEH
jgi:hypothetical protein